MASRRRSAEPGIFDHTIGRDVLRYEKRPNAHKGTWQKGVVVGFKVHPNGRFEEPQVRLASGEVLWAEPFAWEDPAVVTQTCP